MVTSCFKCGFRDSCSLAYKCFGACQCRGCMTFWLKEGVRARGFGVPSFRFGSQSWINLARVKALGFSLGVRLKGLTLRALWAAP